MTIEARIVLFRYKPKIVAITGTVGKTSTKDAVFSIFQKFFYARKNPKSFNSEFGVPLTILDLENQWSSPIGWIKNMLLGLAYIFLPNRYPRWLILEIGTDRPGDIKKIAKWLKPDIVVATRFADIPVHVEFFDSPEDVIKEEQLIAHSLKKDGVLIINNDDDHSVSLKNKIGCRTISFGMSQKAGVQASHFETLYDDSSSKKPTGIRFRADFEKISGPVIIKDALGVQHVYPVLAALAAGVSQGLNMVKMSQIFADHEIPPGRMRLIPGKLNSTIIDDTYNSSPIAAERALEALKNLDVEGRKIAVLGDMRELGDFSDREHKRIGKMAGEIAQMIVFVGDCSGQFSTGAFQGTIKKQNIYEFDKAEQAADFISKNLKENDVVLVKGSQSIRLEKVVKTIMAEPERAEKLLVRQEEEWFRIV